MVGIVEGAKQKRHNPLPSKSETTWDCTQKIFFYVIFLLKKNFYCYSITVVYLFSPSLHPTPAEPTSLPHFHPPPWFCPCALYSSSCNPLSSLSPPHSPLAIVRLWDFIRRQDIEGPAVLEGSFMHVWGCGWGKGASEASEASDVVE